MDYGYLDIYLESVYKKYRINSTYVVYEVCEDGGGSGYILFIDKYNMCEIIKLDHSPDGNPFDYHIDDIDNFSFHKKPSCIKIGINPLYNKEDNSKVFDKLRRLYLASLINDNNIKY